MEGAGCAGTLLSSSGPTGLTTSLQALLIAPAYSLAKRCWQSWVKLGQEPGIPHPGTKVKRTRGLEPQTALPPPQSHLLRKPVLIALSSKTIFKTQ